MSLSDAPCDKHLKKLMASGRLVTRIHGVWYDVTEFAPRHPGGEVIRGVCNGNDGTAMFVSSHFNTPSLEKQPGVKRIAVDYQLPEVPFRFDDSENSFLYRVKKEIFHYFKSRGIDYSTPTIRARLAFYAMLAVSFYSLTRAYIYGEVWGCVMAGVLSWNFAGTLVHDHGAHRVNAHKRSVLLNQFMSLVNAILFPGAFQSHFMSSHYGHHSAIHDNDLDSDNHLIFPMMRWSYNKPLYWFHAYQHLYWPLASSVYLTHYIGKAFMADKRQNWWKRFNHSFRAKRDPAFMWAVVSAVVVHFVVPMWFQGIINGFGLYVVFLLTYSVGGHFFATANHFLVPISDDLDKAIQTGKSVDWAYHTVKYSGDYLVHDWLAYYLSGGFNCHGLHHLLPSIHPSHLAEIYPLYEKICAEFDYPVVNVTSWSEMFARHNATLWSLGNHKDATTTQSLD